MGQEGRDGVGTGTRFQSPSVLKPVPDAGGTTMHATPSFSGSYAPPVSYPGTDHMYVGGEPRMMGS